MWLIMLELWNVSFQQMYTENLVLINYCFLDSSPVAFADADKIMTQATQYISLLYGWHEPESFWVGIYHSTILL